jgi:hypothetical protein
LGVVSWVVIESLMESIVEWKYESFQSKLDALIENGTDLQALAKDIFRWLDNAFWSNPWFWSPRVSIFQEISSEMRRYPKPELLWKKKVWIGMWGGETAVKPSVNPVASTVIKDQKTNSIVQTPIVPKDTLESMGDSVESKTKHSKSQTLTTTKTTPFKWSYEELLQQITTKIEKKMVQSILSKQTTIDVYEDDKMTLIVINRLYASTLAKEDTIKYVESVASEVVWCPIKIEVIYMSKEDFMKKQLGG